MADSKIEAAEGSLGADRSSQGLAFLDELDFKHNQVLHDLDELNARIEDVLNVYAQSRQA